MTIRITGTGQTRIGLKWTRQTRIGVTRTRQTVTTRWYTLVRTPSRVCVWLGIVDGREVSGPPFTLLQIVEPKWWVKTLTVSVSADGSRMIICNRHGCVDVKNRSSVRNLQRKNGKVAKDWLISSKTWTIPNRAGSLKAKQVSCNPKRQKSYYCYLNAESNWNHRAFHQSTQRSMVLGWKLLRKEAGLRV